MIKTGKWGDMASAEDRNRRVWVGGSSAWGKHTVKGWSAIEVWEAPMMTLTMPMLLVPSGLYEQAKEWMARLEKSVGEEKDGKTK